MSDERTKPAQSDDAGEEPTAASNDRLVGLLGVFRTVLVWGFRLPWLGPGILARPR